MMHWAASGGVKVKRAEQHIDDLIAEIATFLKRDPYFFVGERDEEAGRIRYRIHVREQPPLHLGAVAGDALHNLRSALDILWRGVWYPGGGGATDYGCEFPIFETADGLKRRHPQDRFVKGGRKAAVEIAYGAKPYKGGNDLLWMLHEGNALDKHRLLIPVFARLFRLDFPPNTVTVGKRTMYTVATITWEGPLHPIEDGAVIWDHPIGQRPKVDVDFKPSLDIAFGEVGPLKGQPMVGVLYQMVQEVERIVQAFRVAGLIT